MKMEEWKECKLSEIMDLIGGGTPKTSNPDYWGGDIPWISVKDFNGERRYVGDTEKKITKLGLENSSTKILSKGDIIISARGTVGELAIIPSDMAFNQSCYGLRAKDFVDSCFLYYLLKQSVNILKHNTHGSVFDTITRETFENISVKLPPLPTQQKIAAILSSLDDKIELNNKINTNLEQQAGALFKNWFVDFEPFGGKMPEGWKVGKLSEIGTIVGGSTPSKAKKDYYTNNGIAWITPKDLSNDKSKFISHGETDITELGFENSSAIKMPKGTVLYSSRAPIGYIAIAKNEVTTNQGFKSVIPDPNVGNAYIYYFLKSNFELIDNMASGSTFKEISGTAMKNVPVLIPDDKTLYNFQTMSETLFSQQELLENENRNLSAIRNTLLPKLINGEIEV
ncbi:MAG: restriction endonuclease subunit S [Spirochaetia bacterium]|nr:restriction endonuclease subunit S [Spirochaetia bacterium]